MAMEALGYEMALEESMLNSEDIQYAMLMKHQHQLEI